MTVTGVRRAGEHAVLLDVSAEPSSVASAVRGLASELRLTLTEVVPGAVTVLVSVSDSSTLSRLVAALPELEIAPPEAASPGLIELPVCYDGPDLEAVADAAGLSVSDVITRHSQATYQAAFTGFAPGFAYLTGLDPVLRLPRRANPRSSVPPGSVAIADAYSAVYPRASPGGWHLLGTTDATIFDAERDPPALIAPGSTVRFVAR